MPPPDIPALATRKEKLRGILQTHKLDVLLIFATNRNSSFSQWATGTKPRIFHYYYLTPKTSGFLAIDYHVESLRLQTEEPISPIIEDLVERDLAAFLKPFKRIGIAGLVPLTHLQNVYKAKDFVIVDEEFHHLLLSKSQEEIEGITKSAQIVHNVLRRAKQWVQAGITEEELARELQMALLAKAEDLSFALTVISGPRLKEATAGTPTSRVIGDKDMVCIDAGVIARGYSSDCTRMYFVNEPEAEERYKKLRQAHRRVITHLAVGMPIREIVGLYKEALTKDGLPAESLVEGDLGHSIGYNVHEYPFIYRPEYDKYALQEGMVFTLEPEIVFPDYRLRVEDMVVMKDGKPQRLTQTLTKPAATPAQ